LVLVPMQLSASRRSMPTTIRRDRSGGYRVWHIAGRQSSART